MTRAFADDRATGGGDQPLRSGDSSFTLEAPEQAPPPDSGFYARVEGWHLVGLFILIVLFVKFLKRR